MPASLASILAVAKTGLLSQQFALQTTSHNLANATTQGYSRQRAELVPGTPLMLPEGMIGTGVRVADITRARNELLDGIYRRETSLFHGFETEHEALRSVESVFGEPGMAGLGTTIDEFWNAWSDLANDPSSSAARAVVASRGQQLVDHFRRIDASLDTVTGQVAAGLGVGVDVVNDILRDLADLNADVAAAVASGNSAPDLMDRRDVLLDELATYVPIDVTPRDTGAVGVAINGISVVEGITYQQLSLGSGPGGITLETSAGLDIAPTTGRIGGWIEVLNDDFTDFRTQLDELAQGFVERVNALHTTGTNPLGGTGVLFFDDFGDPTTVTAGTIVLDAAILADSQAIAAGSPDGLGNYQAGANDIALALAGLRDSAPGGVLGTRTIGEAHRDLVADIGVTSAAAREARESHEVLMGASQERRESISGVASDEELIKVVQIQAAYAAASRLVSVVDEMYQTLLAV